MSLCPQEQTGASIFSVIACMNHCIWNKIHMKCTNRKIAFSLGGLSINFWLATATCTIGIPTRISTLFFCWPIMCSAPTPEPTKPT